MRKVSVLVAVTLLTLTGAARAQDEAPAAPAGDSAAPAPAAAPETVAAPAAAPAAADSKMQLGLNLLPMALGKFTASAGGQSSSSDAAFAYGVGLTFGYNVIPGLSIGIAPQALFNVKEKDASGDSAKEYDLMARIAYAYTVAPKIAVYGEVLPGYSIIAIPSNDLNMSNPKGLVLAFGVGAAMDVTDQLFLNLGIGYQMGFQKTSVQGTDVDFKTKFLRIAVGAGVKL